MTIKEEIRDNIAILYLKGNMMGGPDTMQIHEKIKSLLVDKIQNVVIDLSKVKWMNSSGLGSLMACMSTLKNGEGQLKISGATDNSIDISNSGSSLRECLVGALSRVGVAVGKAQVASRFSRTRLGSRSISNGRTLKRSSGWQRRSGGPWPILSVKRSLPSLGGNEDDGTAKARKRWRAT